MKTHRSIFSRTTSMLVCALCLLWAGSVHAQDSAKEPPTSPGIKVNVLSGAKRVMTPLAVPDTKGVGNQAKKVQELLRRDLNMAGFFKLLPNSYFFDASKEGMTAETINFGNWTNVNAQGLVKSSVTTTGGKVTVDLRLYVVNKKTQAKLKWRTQTVDAANLDATVHAFANAVVEYYTGKPGVFGTPIAFISRNRSGLKQVYVTDMSGTNVRAITSNNSINLIPRYSKGKVYYTSYQARNPDLWVYSGGKHRKLSSQRGQNSGASACGNKLAVTLSMGGSNTDIYLIDPNTGKKLRRLTDSWAIDVSPTWSPDCSKIAFVSDRGKSPHIYVMNADGSGQKRLTQQGSYNTNPEWSPAGDVIAFQGRDGKGAFDIFTVNMGGGIERLTQNQGNNESPSFSPDGRYIVFTSDRLKKRSKSMWLMTADGQFQRQVFKGNGRISPSWGR